MEQEVLRLLSSAQVSTGVLTATAQLETLYTNEAFPIALINIASESQIETTQRQQALLVLKQYVQSAWSSHFDEFKGVALSDTAKAQVRLGILPLLRNPDRRLRVASAYVVSKIASADFPEDWPGLLSELMRMAEGSDDDVHGALRVLTEIVDDFTDEQFFGMAHKLVQMLAEIARNEGRNFSVRSLAIHVFRSSMDLLEMVKAKFPDDVKDFMDETLPVWIPFFKHILDSPFPDAADPSCKGIITIKTQVLRTIVRIKHSFNQYFAQYIPSLFASTWVSLNGIKERYAAEFVATSTEGRLVDSDGLPFSLDLFVLEELDFIKSCLKSKDVKSEVESGEGENSPLYQLVFTSTILAQITMEDSELWDVDLNIFLSEETSVTADYSPRNAAGDLILELCQWKWLGPRTSRALWNHTQRIYNADNLRLKEAALYMWDQVLSEYGGDGVQIEQDIVNNLVVCITNAMSNTSDNFLRARGYLCAGTLVESMGAMLEDKCVSFLEQTIHASTQDEDAIVKIACIKVLERYINALPHDFTQKYQQQIISSIGTFLTEIAEDAEENQDALAVLVETLHAILGANYAIALDPSLNVIDLLFTMASHGLGNLQVTGLVQDTLQAITEDQYASFIPLCAKILPGLNTTIDADDLTKENNLTLFATDILLVLAQNAPVPLPDGFLGSIIPRAARILMISDDNDLLRKCCEILKELVRHDPQGLYEWRNEEGKSGLEVLLVIIDRLLRPGLDEAAAMEVGGLAAEVVDRLSDHLGPFLPELLAAVAQRLNTATIAPFIQNLILVFARLANKRAKDVIDFLSSITIDGQNGLVVVMGKWLENSSFFSGYSEIRENITALAQLYFLNDPRLKSVIVKGDMIVNTSNRIITRSQARSNPTQYTQVSVPVKIIKTFVAELAPGLESTGIVDAVKASATSPAESDDEWEDYEDLGYPGSKDELLALAGETTSRSSRRQDDATHAFLVDFFKNVAANNTADFSEIFQQLSPEEKFNLQKLESQGM